MTGEFIERYNREWLLKRYGHRTPADVRRALTRKVYAQTARDQLPDDPLIADTLGWIYYKKNVYLRANSLLKEAAEKLPDNPMVQYHYGMAQHKNGDTSGAKETLQAALKLSTDFPGSDDARETLKNL